MRLAIIMLSPVGARLQARLAAALEDASEDASEDVDCYVHESVPADVPGTRFARMADLTRDIFGRYEGLVFVAPCGVAVRAVAPVLRHKLEDPGVVVVDVLGRWAVSLLGGHEGGANALAVRVANALGAEPIVTTTTEAMRTVIVGVGCRRGVPASAIVEAVHEALAEAGVDLAEVRLLASATIKAGEAGLREAAHQLGVPLRFIPDEEIRNTRRVFTPSAVAQARVNLPAVAEPAALLAGRRTRFILQRRIHNGVTVALAREGCES